MELFYNAAVTPWFHVTPDLQILDPAQQPHRDGPPRRHQGQAVVLTSQPEDGGHTFRGCVNQMPRTNSTGPIAPASRRDQRHCFRRAVYRQLGAHPARRPGRPDGTRLMAGGPSLSELGSHRAEPGSIHGDRVPLVHGGAAQPHRPARGSVFCDGVSRQRTAVRRHAVRRRRRCAGTAGYLRGRPSRPEAKPIDSVGAWRTR